MPDIEERIANLERQQSTQTRALRLILEGRLDGEMPHAAGEVVALEGGTTSITVGLGKLLGAAATPEPEPAITWKPSDLRGALPTRRGSAYTTRALSGITGVDYHYTASAPTATVWDIAAYQVGPTAQEDFPSIAYTIVVDLDRARLCHDLGTRVWHNGAPNANTTRLSTCWIGNESPTARQIEEMARAHVWYERQLGRKLDARGHGDTFSTQCPGPNRARWWPQLIARIEALRRG